MYKWIVRDFRIYFDIKAIKQINQMWLVEK